MSLRRAVAVPFRSKGRDRMSESEFVVALSLDRDWFSPEQAKRLVDVAATEGLLAREADDVAATFDPNAVDVPQDFEPGEDVLRQRSSFERILDALVDAGIEKQAAVADVNRLQSELGVTVEAAAVVYARKENVAVAEAADRAAGEL